VSCTEDFTLDRQQFYRQQAESFREFSNKTPDGDLLSIFNTWISSKDFSHEDRREIWKRVRRLGKEPELQVNLKIQYVEDPILFDQLVRIVLLAIELADKNKEDAEKLQQKVLDDY
jgi:hypothetical protein